MKNLWIARDKDDSIYIFREKPIVINDGYWIAPDFAELYLRKWNDELRELTFENSPMEVELKLRKDEKR